MEEYKLAKINPETATKEEIEHEIERLRQIKNDNNNTQMSLKIFINSMYGATGNEYFIGFNVDVAEAVTLTGQNLIKFTSKIINTYFKEHWHKDKELHKILGVVVIDSAIYEDVVAYTDTDSNYVAFDKIIDTISNWEESGYTPITFILAVYENKLKQFFDDMLSKYAKKWNTENIQNFEMEAISYSGIWLAKKKYMLDAAWKEAGKNEDGTLKGIEYEPLSKIKSKGVEIIQSSTPPFGRKNLQTIVNYIFKVGNDLEMRKFTGQLKKLKDQFKLAEIEDISLGTSLSNYNKYVISDRKTLELQKGIPIHVRAAAIHNWSVNNSNYKDKYNLIKSGDKIKYYYVKTDNTSSNIFGYLPGMFPYEFAPEIDYDIMFEKVILKPLNRILESIKKEPIPSNLIYMKKWG